MNTQLETNRIVRNQDFDDQAYKTDSEYRELVDSLYVECTECGAEFYTDNEDDHVVGLCPEGCGYTCESWGSDYVKTSDYCNCEDRPCCGC
jgi:hypothetical protein